MRNDSQKCSLLVRKRSKVSHFLLPTGINHPHFISQTHWTQLFKTNHILFNVTLKLLYQGLYRSRKTKFQDFSRIFTFFQDSFFIDSNSPNTAYTQDFFPIWDCRCISPLSALIQPDFSSAYCLCMLLTCFTFLDFPLARFHF